MSDGMLHEILDVERQIEAEIAEEKKKAEAWLADEKTEIDRWSDEAMEKASAEACRSVERSCQAVRDQGAKKLRAMRRRVRHSQSLPDEKLIRILQPHLRQLLRGGDDDHPDGQD